MHKHFRKGAYKGAHNIIVQVLHVLQTDSNGVNLYREQREVELKRIELLWMDRLMSEYPQGLKKRWEKETYTTNENLLIK